MSRAPSTISLTEAITTLALGKSLATSELHSALASSELGISRADVHRLAQAAAGNICDAGFTGQLEIWGTRALGESCLSDGDTGRVERLSPADLMNYRHYELGVDALWHHALDIGHEANLDAASAEFIHAFAAHAAADNIRNVKVIRSGFDKFQTEWRNPAPKRFSPIERDEWIIKCVERNVDVAYRQYRIDPRNDGTKQAEFRMKWRELRRPTVGRPRKFL